MTYTKKAWQDSPSTATPITAQALNNLESQHDEAVAEINRQATDAATPLGAAITKTLRIIVKNESTGEWPAGPGATDPATYVFFGTLDVSGNGPTGARAGKDVFWIKR